jgi:hypothetical protein
MTFLDPHISKFFVEQETIHLVYVWPHKQAHSLKYVTKWIKDWISENQLTVKPTLVSELTEIGNRPKPDMPPSRQQRSGIPLQSALDEKSVIEVRI